MDKPVFHPIEEIDGAYFIVLGRFKDKRGLNSEGYNKSVYDEVFKSLEFTVDAHSVSKKNTIRGFHGDIYNHKLVQCLFGQVQFFLIDRRPDSKTYNNVFEEILHYERPVQILIPPGVVNAHLCMSENCVFTYKVTNKYVEQSEQLHVKWNDPKFKLNWIVTYPVLSDRDK